MFQHNLTSSYTLTDATIEIVVMLLVAFVLGYLLHYFSAKETSSTTYSEESLELLEQIKIIKMELKKCLEEKSAIKKSLTIEHGTQIDELKEKLSSTRADLENCLASKANTKNINTFPIPIALSENNDLKKIEGIGPVISKILNQAGIDTYHQLAESTEETLRNILNNYGSRYKVHNPSSWPKQAELAANEQWEELKSFQKTLNS
jgi:predicted flap endonuclease-1-like 5' DNA nuclease